LSAKFTSMNRNRRKVIFHAPLGVGCVVMVPPRISLPALLIGLAGCYKRGKRQCNWAFLILLRALQLKSSRLAPLAGRGRRAKRVG
jgi:hypothetical protein